MPAEHARLSPSASARWLSCPASVRLSEEHGTYETSVYADEGTKAHELAELRAARVFGKISRAVYDVRFAEWYQASGLSDEEITVMGGYVDKYVSHLRSRVAEIPGAEIMLEVRVQTGIPECWGTSDALIYSPTHVEIVDLKYGAGVRVDAYENPQLKLYGIGGLEEYGDLLGETKTVTMTIVQPRVGDGEPSSYTLPAGELRAWRDSVLPIAEEALYGSTHFAPSEKACRWCPVAGICKTRVEKATEEDFGTDVALISPEELGELLGRIPEIEAWCAAVKAHALDSIYSKDASVPGWKVVAGRGRRTISNPGLAIQRLIDAGCPAEKVVEPKVKTLAVLEKVVGGAATLAEILGDTLTKPPGAPALVPESDPRPAINPNNEAAKEFG